MKIDSIKSYGAQKVFSYNKINNQTPHFKGKEEKDEFKSEKTDKPSFLNSIQKIFKKEKISFEDLTPEKQKSIEIDSDICEIYDEVCALKKGGKKMAKETAKLLSYGAKNNYKTSAKTGENGASITYGNLNPKTKIPDTMTVWQKDHPSKPEIIYNFHGDENNPFAYYTIESVSDPNLASQFGLINNKIVCYMEQEGNSDIVKTIMPQKNGFYYTEEKKNKEGETIQTVTEIYINETEKDFYSVTEDGVLKTYIFDDKEDMWKLEE